MPGTTLTPNSLCCEPSPSTSPPPPVQAPPHLSLSDWKIQRDKERKEKEEKERSDKRRRMGLGLGPMLPRWSEDNGDGHHHYAASTTAPCRCTIIDIGVDLKEMKILKAIQRSNDSVPSLPEPSVATHAPPELMNPVHPKDTTTSDPKQPVAPMEQPFKSSLSVGGRNGPIYFSTACVVAVLGKEDPFHLA
ncbi:hypothetical protein BU17DRAFT_78985 [Hysterangium stoloniferum]|nr:hypothetical protein BU17DRAFT_78985 [Hysterangium stoloniferum]